MEFRTRAEAIRDCVKRIAERTGLPVKYISVNKTIEESCNGNEYEVEVFYYPVGHSNKDVVSEKAKVSIVYRNKEEVE